MESPRPAKKVLRMNLKNRKAKGHNHKTRVAKQDYAQLCNPQSASEEVLMSCDSVKYIQKPGDRQAMTQKFNLHDDTETTRHQIDAIDQFESQENRINHT